MNKIIIPLILMFLLSGCGAIEQLGQNCGGDLKPACRLFFGGNGYERQRNQIDLINKRIDDIESDLSQVLNTVSQHSNSISVLSFQLDFLNALIPTLTTQNDINNFQNQIDLLEVQIDALDSLIGTPITGLQSVVVQHTAAILQLQQNHSVTKLIDPCGDYPGKFDEIFLRTSSGHLIASFSDHNSGHNTRFSELVPGTFTTTDGTGCTFTVTNVGGTLIVTPSVEY